MRILLINYEYPPVGAGAATASRHLAQGLVDSGHQVCVLTSALGAGGETLEHGVRVIRLDTDRQTAEQAGLGQMARYVRLAACRVPALAREVDVCIVFFSMPCGPLGLVARWLGKVPYVVSLRGGDVPGAEPGLKYMHTLLMPLRRLVLRRASAVIANSQGLRQMSLAADPVAVNVIHNGVDVADFFPAALPRENDPPVCLFVGRWRPQKHLSSLLQIFSRLRDEGVPFVLRLVGGGSEEPVLRQLVRELDLGNQVSFHPWCEREALVSHYQEADLFVNLSLYEGMPNTVLEAMACGLPVIASDVAGNDAVVEQGVTGILVKLDDPQAILGALRQLLGTATQRREMGDMARAAAENKFSIPAMVAAYESTLKKAVIQTA